ncbi:recombinase family protein [Paraburkholderia sp. A2WS-5]|uniref:recombinase family protein n=1 Tax=unclassified Paraburkholderia TaxID=2615204 RepID=UPI003B7E5020
MFIRAYLRASTKDQDAQRARDDLAQFAAGHNVKIAAYYAENESGATLHRPELMRLLNDSHPGDVILVEQVDRLSRLNDQDWKQLRIDIQTRGLRVVALDLPTSHQLITSGDAFTGRILEAINAMMLDMLAAIARKDYEDRKRRTRQGIEKAKADGKYKGRTANNERNTAILAMLDSGHTWSEVIKATGVSRSTLSRLLNERRAGSNITK